MFRWRQHRRCQGSTSALALHPLGSSEQLMAVTCMTCVCLPGVCSDAGGEGRGLRVGQGHTDSCGQGSICPGGVTAALLPQQLQSEAFAYVQLHHQCQRLAVNWSGKESLVMEKSMQTDLNKNLSTGCSDSRELCTISN